ncbi:MAG: glycosyltransferase [Sphingobacteriia bacterium]|nr:MAG: glycosyltransferase [Sphingobacteriia bacterium]
MINYFIYLLACIGLAYCVLIGIYHYWFLQLKQYVPVQKQTPQIFFSIIIPARNEAIFIEDCLKRIQAQNYPSHLFEVIVVNDHSSDNTGSIVEMMKSSFASLRLINLSDHVTGNINAYKKRAIEIAVAETKGEWIITTDADCAVLPDWLFNFDQFIQEKDPVFVAAPVMFSNTKTWLGLFQLLDFMSLQGITAAAVAAGFHSMCNGANLAYSKKAFYAVGQFKGIDQLASGDDMFLMYKIKKEFPGRLGFLYSDQMIVTTAPMPDWKSFFNQRVRWASKADSYSDLNIFWVLVLVYLFNAGLLLGLIAGIFVEGIYPSIAFILLLKTIVEIIFLYPVADFFKLRPTLWIFPFMQPFHIFYTVVAGWLGKFGTYQWKGRTVK